MNDNSIAQNLGNQRHENTLQFFKTILPPEGVHYLVTIREYTTASGETKTKTDHHPFESLSVMAKAVEQFDTNPKPGQLGVYHACASYIHESVDGGVWPNGEPKRAYRVPENHGRAKALWIDIDCGEDKAQSAKGYATKKDALLALTEFCRRVRLPAPLIVDSGGGLHCYWTFTKDVHHSDWKKLAARFKALTQALGLLADPTATADFARILRPVGSHNTKRGERREVKAKNSDMVKPIDPERLDAAINQALADAGVDSHGVQHAASTGDDVGDLINKGKTEFPPFSAETAAESCAQIALMRDKKGDVSYDHWRGVIGFIKLSTDEDTLAHDWSSAREATGHTQTDVDAKLNSWNSGPPTCRFFKSCNPNGCVGCSFDGKVKSPARLGWKPSENSEGDWLESMNLKYVWIERHAAIYRIQHRDFIPIERFNAQYANRTITVQTRNGEKTYTHAYQWLRDKNRRQHQAIVTRPGDPVVTADNCLNDWAGFTVEPIAGDVTPFLNLFAYLFAAERYPLHWLGHLIQYPGIKMFVALVVWSLAEGVGKNLLFETIGALFSPHHYALFGQSEVDDDFCGWIPGTVYGIGDEIRASKNARSQDRLKLWQTATTLRTHDKGQPKREVENLMNLVFLSNHADGMFLSDHDRRFYVHEIKAGPLPETLKNEFLAWRSNGGLKHLLHYLMNLDLEGFDPKGRAPITDAKREMIEASRSDLDRWAMDTVAGSLPLGREIATAEELAIRFAAEYPQTRLPSVATIAKVLVKAGAYRRDNQVRLSNGRKVRALALQRQEFWKQQPETAWRQEMEKRL